MCAFFCLQQLPLIYNDVSFSAFFAYTEFHYQRNIIFPLNFQDW